LKQYFWMEYEKSNNAAGVIYYCFPFPFNFFVLLRFIF